VRGVCGTVATHDNYVGFKVLTAVVMKRSVFWDMTPCRPLKITYFSEDNFSSICLPPVFTLLFVGLFSDPENGSDMFFRNVC
jgi:hypothetical protein